jgi:streptomycin 6-kinase
VVRRWWDGAGAVRLLGDDNAAWVMLLERCATPDRSTATLMVPMLG